MNVGTNFTSLNSSFNRTIEELKLCQGGTINLAKETFNRTIEELKFDWNNIFEHAIEAFNLY